MTEKLARVLFDLESQGHGDPWDRQTNVVREIYMGRALAIVTRLLAAGVVLREELRPR